MKTPLYDEHVEKDARMTSFAGWQMPVSYASIIKEHNWCREAACVFDTCHMGQIKFKGEIESSTLELSFTRNIADLPAGRASYGFFLNEKGGIVDDVIAFKISEEEVLFVVNASSAKKDIKAIEKTLSGGRLSDESSNTAKIDLQGPLSETVFNEVLGTKPGLAPFDFTFMDIIGQRCMVSRTGYTGEKGYEIFCPASRAQELWRKLVEDKRVHPAGLGARDLLRLEMGYCLHGSDIDERTTPLEAGLNKFIDFNKKFTGRDALLKQKEKGVKRKRVALKSLSRRAPRRGFEIFSEDKKIGEITSGSFSPALKCGIAMGYVKSGFEESPAKVRVDSAGEAVMVKLPFYKKAKSGSLKEQDREETGRNK